MSPLLLSDFMCHSASVQPLKRIKGLQFVSRLFVLIGLGEY